MFGSLGRAINWFIDGLVDGFALLDKRSGLHRRLTLVAVADGYAVEDENGERASGLLRVETGPDGSSLQPAEAAANLQHRDVDLALTADEVLVRTLDPLPGESRQYLDTIVRHQLERVAPWRTDDVLYTYRVAPAEKGNDRLLVTVIATARSLHERVIEAVRALQPRELRLLCRDQAFEGGAVAIAIDNGAAGAALYLQRRGLVMATVAVLGLFIVAEASLFGWMSHRAGTESLAVSQEIAQQRHRLLAARARRPVGDQDLKALVERRAHTPFVVLALEALAKALPDDTYLADIRFADGKVRVTGVSHDVSKLVPLIEASPAFADATFFAPTTRLPGAQGDRFHLEARLVPQDQSKP